MIKRLRGLLGLMLTGLVFACSSTDQKVVIIQPYDGCSMELVDSVKLSIEEFYGFRVHVQSSIAHRQKNFVQIKSARFRADSILKDLKRFKPDSVDFVIGLTARDISTTKRQKNGDIKEPHTKYMDWGVFGLGYRPGPSCVVSTFRLKHSNQSLEYERIKKVVLHELGHNLGLKHCPNDCFMQDAAETIKTIDKVPMALCERCWNKIH